MADKAPEEEKKPIDWTELDFEDDEEEEDEEEEEDPELVKAQSYA